MMKRSNRFGAAMSLFLVLCAVLILSAAGRAHAAGEAKYVFLIIGDGMNLEHEIAGSRYWTGEDYGLSFQGLPYQNYVTTWDVTTYNAYANNWDYRWAGEYDPNNFEPYKGYDASIGGTTPCPASDCRTGEKVERYYQNTFLGSKPAATDSASSATALYTGHKTVAGNISWDYKDSANGQISTIAEKMRSQKKAAVGVVSTVQITHATPAAVYAHNVNRNNYSPDKKNSGFEGETIAEELVRFAPEVAIGSGFASSHMTDELVDQLDSGGSYIVVRRQEGVDGGAEILDASILARDQGKKLFGYFGSAAGDFENRVVSDTPGSPSIDRGSAENPTFAQLVTAAINVLHTNQNGFFLMAEQGNLDWRNHSLDYKGMVGCVIDLSQGVQAVIDFVNQEGDDMTWDNSLLIVTSDHSNDYMRIKKFLGKGDLPPQEPASQTQYGAVYDSSSYDGYVTYGMGQHTNELVSVYARGAATRYFEQWEGAWTAGARIIDDTFIYNVMAEAAGIN